jgi:hypothetical protein
MIYRGTEDSGYLPITAPVASHAFDFSSNGEKQELLPRSRQTARVFPGKKEVKTKIDAETFGMRQPGNQIP